MVPRVLPQRQTVNKQNVPVVPGVSAPVLLGLSGGNDSTSRFTASDQRLSSIGTVCAHMWSDTVTVAVPVDELPLVPPPVWPKENPCRRIQEQINYNLERQIRRSPFNRYYIGIFLRTCIPWFSRLFFFY
jgi:hypothetical protein